jgi:hypothetical protein
MQYFGGVTQEERWKNELLNEIRTMNKLLTQVLENNAQVLEKETVTIPQIASQRGRPKGVAR